VPNAELVFSKVSSDNKHVDVMGRARQSFIEDCAGISCLTQNPMENEMIATASG
jgi:hypothetical protein